MTVTTNRNPSTRRFSRGRITGLTLIAVLTLGLGYLHFVGGSTAVSVPAGAHAGQLTLKSCTYHTEKGTDAADCGTLVVPENRADPHSRLIALPVIRIRAHSAHPGAPIFRLEGGPGKTNMKFAEASRFNANHDVVLVGYRGVDGSVRLQLPGGRVGPRALRRLPRPEVPQCLLERAPLVREAAPGKRRRSRRLHTPRTGQRPRGGTESPRLPPDRPVERKRGHPHRDALLLALPGRHPPFGDDRRQPTRQLHLAPEDDGRTDRPLRQPLCARRDVPQAHQRSRRVAGTDRRAHAQPLLVLSDQRRATHGSPASSDSWRRRKMPRRSPDR